MKSKTLAILYFTLSIIVTYVFIDCNPVYNSFDFQLTALTIAAIVWGIQVAGAFIYLKALKYAFLREAGKVCFLGSVSLMASVLINYFFTFSVDVQLRISAANILITVILMAILFAKFLKILRLPFTWLVVWLICLCIAVPLQAKLVGLW
ncbi:MAG TPA: hypothetical protein VF622_08370 [Segetibacter sp.]|jgi:hypothetical protein